MRLALEEHFDPTFTTALALREKQIQQYYRPFIGVHKWFARRPGTVFRNLLLAEFNGSEPLDTSYWRAHELRGVIADPFMGGGTPIVEANRLGFSVVGTDINPMAYWVVRQSLAPLDLGAFSSAADAVVTELQQELGRAYQTECEKCREPADVKYFLWVKLQACPLCGTDNDLFPGYLLAEAERHPRYVLVCADCGALNEYACVPTRSNPAACQRCGHQVQQEGPARRQQVVCRKCLSFFRYPVKGSTTPPRHRLWALEYHCESCKPMHVGRFFKHPDPGDHARFEQAAQRFADAQDLPIPDDAIPAGDETDRLHRWGYYHYRDMFNKRQLLGLGLLLKRIQVVDSAETRHALLTVFSDFLRYQNMLCRYDTYALKCQDIFSVHGFPVGLVQCENNLLGIPGVGSGAFRHFIEKYRTAKRYCEAPFETRLNGRRKTIVFIAREKIQAQPVKHFPSTDNREAYLSAATATAVNLPLVSLDGVFTDPPYFDNVQYAELMDFCFVWLRLGLQDDFSEFQAATTRSQQELTGNTTLGRGIEQFTAGLSAVFLHYAKALKPGAPFVFTYHHNDSVAYVPLVVAILDAGLDCTATLPAAAEMSASLHITGTKSSVLDSVFVCRAEPQEHSDESIEAALSRDLTHMRAAGLRDAEGDLRCLAAGHIARLAINRLHQSWDASAPLPERMVRATTCLTEFTAQVMVERLIHRLLRERENTAGQAARSTSGR